MTTTTTIPGQQLRLYGLDIWCDMGVGIGGDRWPAAELFCDFVLDDVYHSFFRSLFHNRRIIELGAGNGMAGILIGKLFAPSKVVITDLADHLRLIEHNITLNTHAITSGEEHLENIKAFVLDWLSSHTAEETLGKFDIVLALECIYRESLYGPLIETLNTVCHDDSIVFLGLTRSFGKARFFDMLIEAKFDYTMVPIDITKATMKRKEGGDAVGLFIIQRKKNNNPS